MHVDVFEPRSCEFENKSVCVTKTKLFLPTFCVAYLAKRHRKYTAYYKTGEDWKFCGGFNDWQLSSNT